jgi:CxxC motif-containing protein
MNKKLTCIECPKGCALSVDIENCRVLEVRGNQCPRGKDYAVSEVENPLRILTSSVLGIGLSMKMVPVRTDRPIPKVRLAQAMKEVKALRVDRAMHIGEVIVEDFLGLGVKLITTRDIS